MTTQKEGSYEPREWMDSSLANGEMGSLIHPEQRAEDMGFTLLPEKDAYAEMSKRLLGGWTMLNEHCPISGFPLLKKGGVTWSVRCNMEVKTAEQAPNAQPMPTHAPGIELADQLRAKPVAQKKQADPETFAPAPPTLAERLRAQGGAPEFDEGEVDLRMPSAIAAAAQPAAPIPDGAVISSSEISSQLSDLLLKGWRMLEEECPVTQVSPLRNLPLLAIPRSFLTDRLRLQACPLMQQKVTGRKYSVALQKFMDELDNNAPAATAAKAPAPAPAPAPAAADEWIPNSGSDDDDDEEYLMSYRQQRLAQMRKEAAAPAAAPPASAPAAAAPAAAAVSGFSGDVNGVMERASASLVAQIASAEERLRSPVSVSDAIALAQLIGASATALRQIQPAGGPLL